MSLRVWVLSTCASDYFYAAQEATNANRSLSGVVTRTTGVGVTNEQSAQEICRFEVSMLIAV
jgi:hypothetical protein